MSNHPSHPPTFARERCWDLCCMQLSPNCLGVNQPEFSGCKLAWLDVDSHHLKIHSPICVGLGVPQELDPKWQQVQVASFYPPYPPEGHVPCYFNIACFIQHPHVQSSLPPSNFC